MGGTRGVHFAAEVGGALRAWPLAWVELRDWTPDPLDANYQRARGRGNLGSSQPLSTVHASGCTLLLRYFLLYARWCSGAEQPSQRPSAFQENVRVHASPPQSVWAGPMTRSGISASRI